MSSLATRPPIYDCVRISHQPFRRCSLECIPYSPSGGPALGAGRGTRPTASAARRSARSSSVAQHCLYLRRGQCRQSASRCFSKGDRYKCTCSLLLRWLLLYIPVPVPRYYSCSIRPYAWLLN
jgi:hypothetical protein